MLKLTFNRKDRTSAFVLVALTLLAGCDPQQPKPSPPVLTLDEIKARNFATEANDPTDRIFVSDAKVYPDHSGERVIGDERPLYVAEGRVTSNLAYAIADQVVLKVYFVDSNNQGLDTAEVTLRNIAPQETKAFRQTVSLLPPSGKPFKFAVEVKSVRTSPAPRPYPFYK